MTEAEYEMRIHSRLDTIFIQSKLNLVKWKIKKKLTKNIDIESIESKISLTPCVELCARYLELAIAFIQNITNVKLSSEFTLLYQKTNYG